MHYVGRRASETSPLRSLPMFRTVESVFGASRQAKVGAELRIAADRLAGELALYAKACVLLGKANRKPLYRPDGSFGCRAVFQREAMQLINARRKLLRAAQRQVAAAEAAVASLTPADAFAHPSLAAMAAQAAAGAAPARLAA